MTGLPALLVAVLLGGCLGEPSRSRLEREFKALEEPWLDPQAVIAEVDGVPISRGEYYRRVLRRFGSRTMLSGIIKEELFRQEAARRGLTVSREEIQARVDRLMEEEKERAGGAEELRRIYRQEGLSLEDVRRDYERDVESHLMAGKVARALRAVDEAALREYYSKSYARTRYRVRHIPYSYASARASPEETARLKTLALEKAERTVKRVRAGEDFERIARQESEDATREKGGDIGFVTEDMEMDPAMKDVVFKLKPGEVSDPVENSIFGAYHVVQVTEVVPHESYAECEERMRAELRDREPDLEEIRDVLERLRERASVRILGSVRDPVGAEASASR